MFFPAGIPLVALVALVVYNSMQEKKREEALTAPRTGAGSKRN
jgi:hypothetical protein